MFAGPSPLLFGVSPRSTLRPQDTFATSIWNNAPTSITNGLDLSGKGGLVWIRQRSDVNDHVLFDTQRGVGKTVSSNLTDAETSISGVTAFYASGFSLGNSFKVNSAGSNYVGWSFRRAPKFFDIVTYTGDGTSGRVIPHALGIDPGLIILRRRDAGDNWRVRHRSATGELYLNLTQAQDTSFPSIPAASATNFTVGTNSNASGGTYVAYLIAHDPDTTNGIVQCGSFTPDGSGNATVNLGWQPQWILFKLAANTGDWFILDSARGWTSGADNALFPNTSGAESSLNLLNPTSFGFTAAPGALFSGQHVYCAVRAPIT